MGMQSDYEKNPSFFVDAMLGNIAKKLRLMGYDSKYEADIVDENGESVPLGSGGYLVLKKPWPAMARTIWGNHPFFHQVATACNFRRAPLKQAKL